MQPQLSPLDSRVLSSNPALFALYVQTFEGEAYTIRDV